MVLLLKKILQKNKRIHGQLSIKFLIKKANAAKQTQDIHPYLTKEDITLINKIIIEKNF